MSALLLLVGCRFDRVDLTGGGEVRIALHGDDLAEVALLVDGMSEEDLDVLFADGHKLADVFGNLDDERLEPAHESALHLARPGHSTDLEVVDNDVAGFAPCGLAIRHAELHLGITNEFDGLVGIQFDERAPDDPSIAAGGPPPDTLVAFESEPMQPDEMQLTFFGKPNDVSGFAVSSVRVLCADLPRSATLTVEWEFDSHVHRRAHQRGWETVPFIVY